MLLKKREEEGRKRRLDDRSQASHLLEISGRPGGGRRKGGREGSGKEEISSHPNPSIHPSLNHHHP